MNSPQYTPEELEKFRTDNEKGVTVDGVHYTGYQATQMQRSLERAIRRQKNRIMVDEGTGDTEKLAQDKTNLELLHQRYRAFSKAAGLRTQYERTEVAGYHLKATEMDRAAQKAVAQYSKINGLPLKDGLTARITDHVMERAVQRGVPGKDAIDALQNPLKTTIIKYDEKGRPSCQMIGARATVAVNLESGAVTSVWKTSAKRAAKLQEKKHEIELP